MNTRVHKTALAVRGTEFFLRWTFYAKSYYSPFPVSHIFYYLDVGFFSTVLFGKLETSFFFLPSPLLFQYRYLFIVTCIYLFHCYYFLISFVESRINMIYRTCEANFITLPLSIFIVLVGLTIKFFISSNLT